MSTQVIELEGFEIELASELYCDRGGDHRELVHRARAKGNPESFMSCSHGAGRAMSRTEAKRRFTLDDRARCRCRMP